MISLIEASESLNISQATLSNWLKKLKLKAIDRKISIKDFELIKSLLNSKLSSRANKTNSQMTFVPREYFDNNKLEVEKAQRLLNFINSFEIDLESKIFVLANLLFYKQGRITDFKKGLELKKDSYQSNNLINELRKWNIDIKKNLKKLNEVTNFDIPKSKDFLGAMYQSLLSEGQKAKWGSYYTPPNEIRKVLKDFDIADNHKLLDPCCGTGSFLIAFSEITKNPEMIYGYDQDEMAIKIARLNLIYMYPNMDNFKINIFKKNSLALDESEKFDFILTNPPWGYNFNPQDLKELKKQCPMIKSGESFSYFVISCLNKIKSNGKISLILPESILKVKVHKDIRTYILSHSKILKLNYLGPIFDKVMSNVVRMDLNKDFKSKSKIEINYLDQNYEIDQKDFKSNQDFQFSIQKNPQDDLIIKKVYKIKHLNLKNKAQWGLGIVTGDNDKFIFDSKTEGLDLLITGKNIEPFKFSPPYRYIKFLFNEFQQCVPEKLFKVKEKVVYKFISKRIVLVLDNKGHYTLNSANFFIPHNLPCSNKVIVALFNSSLYNFMFQKMINSIKVLRSDLELLPIPNFSKKVLNRLEKLHDDIVLGKKTIENLDEMVYNLFKITDKEIKYIVKNIK